jgi:hypothetical protein
MPSVQGDRVAWLQGFSSATYGDSDIFLLNLTTNEMVAVNESLSAKGGLAMNGDRIAWYSHSEKRDGTKTSIYLHDLAMGGETVVSSDPGLQTQTTLSEKYIAWSVSPDPARYPPPLSQIHIYTIAGGTTQTIPTTTMNQYDPIIAGDYVVYTECTPYEKTTVKPTCDSKIFDLMTGTIGEFPRSRDDRNANSDYEYERKIRGFSNGQFLIEEILEGKRVFGLYRIDNLRQAAQPTALTGEPVGPAGNVTVTGSPAPALPLTQPAPGFSTMPLVIAIVISMILQWGDQKNERDVNDQRS